MISRIIFGFLLFFIQAKGHLSLSNSQMTELKYGIPSPPVPTKFPLTSPRGAKLATRVWPVKQPKALCLIVHGGGWHSAYFEDLTNALTKGNIFCASYDQVNCGYSDPEPDAPPGVAHVKNFDCLVEDVFAAIEWMQREAGNPNVPVFLFGESYGGLQVIAAALGNKENKYRIDGVMSSGGLLKLDEKFLPPKPVVKFLVFLSRFFPKMVMPATDFESTFDDAFGDKEWARTARQDPKIVMEISFSLAMGAATMSTGDRLRVQAKKFPVKFYAVHGERDVRTSCKAMEEFVENVGPSKATIDVIDTDGHQLLQDTPEITSDVIEKVKNWILNTIKDLK